MRFISAIYDRGRQRYLDYASFGLGILDSYGSFVLSITDSDTMITESYNVALESKTILKKLNGVVGVFNPPHGTDISIRVFNNDELLLYRYLEPIKVRRNKCLSGFIPFYECKIPCLQELPSGVKMNEPIYYYGHNNISHSLANVVPYLCVTLFRLILELQIPIEVSEDKTIIKVTARIYDNSRAYNLDKITKCFYYHVKDSSFYTLLVKQKIKLFGGR